MEKTHAFKNIPNPSGEDAHARPADAQPRA
jgi:hypothetical protein